MPIYFSTYSYVIYRKKLYILIYKHVEKTLGGLKKKMQTTILLFQKKLLCERCIQRMLKNKSYSYDYNKVSNIYSNPSCKD